MSFLKKLLNLSARYSAPASVSSDSGDLLIDVDMRLAEGRFAEAAELVRSAIKSSPYEVSLQEKLLEVLFVAGDADGFLDASKEYQSGLRRSDRWEATKTLGREMFPDERMFR